MVDLASVFRPAKSAFAAGYSPNTILAMMLR